MKRLIFLIALLPLGLWEQERDSAEVIVERYLKMLNYEAIPKDSMLVLESTVTFHNSADTFTMQRWYAAPTMMRVEVRREGTPTEGYCTNGGGRHREYMRRMGWWDDVDHSVFHQKIESYDYRGQLFNWQLKGVKLSYRGIVTAKGQRLQVVEMLPGFTHSLVNLSETEDLVTLIWANEPFDPARPDTYFQEV